VDLPAILAQIMTLSVADRIRLVEAVQDSIVEEVAPNTDMGLDLTDEQKGVLDRRRAELDANPDNVLTWEQIKAHVRRQS